jgi:hypothetical protein
MDQSKKHVVHNKYGIMAINKKYIIGFWVKGMGYRFYQKVPAPNPTPLI